MLLTDHLRTNKSDIGHMGSSDGFDENLTILNLLVRVSQESALSTLVRVVSEVPTLSLSPPENYIEKPWKI